LLRFLSDALRAKQLSKKENSNFLLNNCRKNIQLQIRNNQPFKWKDVLYQYQHLYQSFQQFSKYAACRSLIQPLPRPYTKSIEQVRDFAAAERYKAGILAFTQQGNHQKNTLRCGW
jgi:hypothetical protein